MSSMDDWTLPQLLDWKPLWAVGGPYAIEQGEMWPAHTEAQRDKLAAMHDVFTGEFSNAAYESMSEHHGVAMSTGESSAQGGGVITETAGAAMAAHVPLLELFGEVTGQGFVLTPNLKVTDPGLYPPQIAKQRQEMAQQYAQQIRARLGAFHGALEDGARQLQGQQSHGQDLADSRFTDGTHVTQPHPEPAIGMGTDASGKPQIQMGGKPLSPQASMVDFKTDKTDSDNHGTDHKRHMWDGMWEIGTGAGLALGGGLVTAGGLAGELPSAGTDTGMTILGIAGVAGGIKQFGDGVDDILNALEDK